MAAFFIDGSDLADGIALCLSGGGYRAMLFHAGAIWRLNELGLLRKTDLISSVSGGSIASGALAVAWDRLQWDAAGTATNLRDIVIAPILRQAEDAIDYEFIVLGLLPLDFGLPACRPILRAQHHRRTKDPPGPPTSAGVRLQYHEPYERP